MKKVHILVLFATTVFLITGLTFFKFKPNAAKRGKVVADSRSGIFDLKLNEASFISIQSVADSTAVLGGSICIIDNNDRPTGESVRMVPRKFPSWFIFGCNDNGTVVTIDIKTLGNGQQQAKVRFSKKQKKGKSKY